MEPPNLPPQPPFMGASLGARDDMISGFSMMNPTDFPLDQSEGRIPATLGAHMYNFPYRPLIDFG